MRGETHLFLAAYYAGPIGAYLALTVLDGRARIGVATGVLCAVVALASGSFYYSAFTVLLVVAAVALRFVSSRDRGAIRVGAFFVGVILAVSLVQLAPTIVYRLANGTNEQVAQRYWFESENYGLRLSQLLLPVDNHRVDALASRKAEYAEQIPQNEGRAATLGLVGSVGFLWLVGVVLAACVGAAGGAFFVAHRRLAALTAVCVLVGITGGLSTLLAVVWPQIRAWNRLSIFIAFFSLAAVGLLLEALRGRYRLRAAGFAALLAVVLAVGVFDQTTDTFVPPHDGLKAEWEGDRTAIRPLEARLPAGARVVQLPYEEFPEPPPGPRPIYEPAKAYLHSDDLRWSWGAMKGRDEDWAADHATRPAAELVPAAREAGFAGVLLDRWAYTDGGEAAIADVRGAVGSDPETSPNGRWLFWPLRGK
jgi:phosphoglycerol transferase